MLADIPDAPVAWKDKRLRPAWWVIVLAALVAIMFLPATMINADEYLYSGQARIMLHGRLLPVDGDPLPGARDLADSEGARYPPGWPLILSVPAIFGFRAMFLASLAAHLLGGAAAARMLVRRGLPSSLVAGYLFHPVFWSFSRTLMSDVPSGAILLLAMDAWEQGRPGIVGASVAYSILTRPGNLLSAIGMGIATWDQRRTRLARVASIASGALIGCTAILLLNLLKYGRAVGSPYSHAGFGLLNGHLLAENLVLYGLGLLFIPPFPLICLLVRPRRVDRWCLVALPVLAFFLLYSYHDSSRRLLETALGGQRLVIPAHVAMVMASSRVWGRLPIPRLSIVVPAAGVVVAVVQYAAVRHLEKRYLPASIFLSSCRTQTIAFNRNASRVALSSDAETYHTIDGRDPIGLGDVVVIATGAPTNQPVTLPQDYQIPPSLRERWSSCRRLGEFLIFDLAGRCSAAAPTCDSSLNPVAGTATNR